MDAERNKLIHRMEVLPLVDAVDAVDPATRLDSTVDPGSINHSMPGFFATSQSKKSHHFFYG